MHLQGWINKARSHWEEFQPKRVSALKKQGTLELALKQAAEQTYLEVNALEERGYQPDEAFQMVRELYLFPPPEDQEPEEVSEGVRLMQEALKATNRTLGE